MHEPSPAPYALPNRARRRSTRGRISTAIGLVTTSALTAHVASAAFGPTVPATVNEAALTAGDVKLGGSNPGSQTFVQDATDFYPGITRYRAVDVTITGTLDMATVSVELTTSGCTGCQTSVLDSDATNGLQLTVERCPAASTFAQTGSSPDASYTCNGVAPGGGAPWVSVIASTPLATALGGAGSHDHTTDISSGMSKSVGDVNHLVFEWNLPTASANSTQGKTSIIDIKFIGTSRNGTSK